MTGMNRIYKEFGIALDGLKKGLFEIAITMSENTRIAKLLYQIFELEKKIDKLYVKTGQRVHELHHLSFAEILNNDDIKGHINKIKTIHLDIRRLEKEINLLREERVKSKLEELKRYMRRGGFTIEELVVEQNSEVIDKYIGELSLPHGAIIIAVIHHEMFNIPQEGLKLTAGDRVFILSPTDAVKEAAALFSSSFSSSGSSSGKLT